MQQSEPKGYQSARVISRIKEAVRERDGYRCTGCGLTQSDHIARTGRRLEVHRLTPGGYYSIEGCVTLCKSCHGPQPRRKRGSVDLAQPPKKRRVTRGVQFYTDDELADAFDQFLASLSANERPTKRAVIETAVREYLRLKGYWPPEV